MSQEPQSKPTSPLSPQEAAVLDALIESMSALVRAKNYNAPTDAPFSTGFAAPTSSPDADKIASLLQLIGQCPAADAPADLTAKTLDRIADVRRRRWFAEQAQALAAPRSGMGWNEVGTIAAILLIGVSLMWPMLGRVRTDARRVACSENLSTAGAALAGYASGNHDQLPRSNAQPGQVWWNVGEKAQDGQPVHSNSAHLYLLVRTGYIAPESLNCPENANVNLNMTRTMHDWNNAAAVSYSYQNQYSPEPARLTRMADTALLADKNPMFAGMGGAEGLHYQSQLSPQTLSNFHSAAGRQNILIANGGVLWSNSPILRTHGKADNIWLANGVQNYNGTEAPADLFDSFLTP